VTRVLLATCRDFAAGEPGHEALDTALAARGLDASWVVWDDPSVDWSTAGLVAVRSTWDYMTRLDEFLAWAARLDHVLLHGSRAFRWNTDKRYLLDLGRAGVPVVPTQVATTEAEVRALVSTRGAWVVKPTVGANGLGVASVFSGSWVPDGLGPWLAQPLVDSVATEGETSVFVIGGIAVAAVVKTPATGEFRVHEQRGGRSRPAVVTDRVRSVALQAYAATERLVDLSLTYARVDLLRHEGSLVVTEVEITEPGLYLDVVPEVATPFADAVVQEVVERYGRT
jgi:glutathione synthase/RimK-type ligase-like ATP-grasp enzyme